MGTACCGRVAGVGVEDVFLLGGHNVLNRNGNDWKEGIWFEENW